MGFPVVAASNTTADTSGSAVTVAMPAGIAAGDLLLVFVAHDTDATITQSGGSDWTKIDDGANGTAVQGCIFAKLAAGGDTLDITDGADNMDTACVSVRITGHNVTDVSSIVLGTAATGSDAAPDPPNCNPNVLDDYLWVEFFAADDDDDTTPYESANYTAVAQIQSASSTSSCLCAVAARELNASAENPGVMAMALAEEWRAQTLAIVGAAVTEFPVDLMGQAGFFGVVHTEVGGG